jgi:hypothetical protein
MLSFSQGVVEVPFSVAIAIFRLAFRLMSIFYLLLLLSLEPMRIPWRRHHCCVFLDIFCFCYIDVVDMNMDVDVTVAAARAYKSVTAVAAAESFL